MRRATVAAAATVLMAVTGCGGSGSPARTDSPGSATPTPAATLPAHTGLVGAIDSARKLALCENVRLYATAVAGGLPDTADQAFAAILHTLRQPPRDVAVSAIAARWKIARARAGDAAIADRLTAFCASLG